MKRDYILVGGLTLFGNAVADSKTFFINFWKDMIPSFSQNTINFTELNFIHLVSLPESIKRKSGQDLSSNILSGTSIIE